MRARPVPRSTDRARSRRRGAVPLRPRRSEVARQSELAAREDVLLDFRRAAADGLDHGRSVRALEAAVPRRLRSPTADLTGCAAKIEGLVADPLRELRRVQLVH